MSHGTHGTLIPHESLSHGTLVTILDEFLNDSIALALYMSHGTHVNHSPHECLSHGTLVTLTVNVSDLFHSNSILNESWNTYYSYPARVFE